MMRDFINAIRWLPSDLRAVWRRIRPILHDLRLAIANDMPMAAMDSICEQRSIERQFDRVGQGPCNCYLHTYSASPTVFITCPHDNEFGSPQNLSTSL